MANQEDLIATNLNLSQQADNVGITDWHGSPIGANRNLSYSDLIFKRCSSVQLPCMTAIASTYTPHGFVVGADGLRVSGNKCQDLTENAQKIFFVDHSSLRGVHAWAGAAHLFSSLGYTFDIPEETQKIIEDLSGTEFARLSDFVMRIGAELYKRILVHNSGNKIGNTAIFSNNEMALGLFVGYINNRAERVQLVFPYRDGFLLPPFLKEVCEAPGDFLMFSGSERVLDDLGKVSRPTSQAEAVDLVGRYIRRCVDKRNEYSDCKNIGGRIHIAIVTPDKVEWIAPPLLSGSFDGCSTHGSVTTCSGRHGTMTPRIKNCLERATHFRDEMLQEVSKQKTADNSDRSRAATAFISMAAGDFKAILTEIANDNNGPALKLFRFLYEDVINALWVQAFAPDDVVGRLLHGTDGQVSGTMAERAAKLDTIFVPPPTVQPAETMFVDIQSKLWKAACSYAHGGSLAINRELAGHDEQSLYEVLRTSTNLFVMLMNGMYELHHKKQNNVLRGIAQTFFAEKW